ncbi:hypothetical protein RCL1_003265 [Eukaryota sp. TZLM3-RCL]
MEPLGFSSLLALIGILFTIISIFIQFIITLVNNGFVAQLSEAKWFNFSLEIFRIVPIISLAFSAHMGLLRLYQELHQRSVKRMFKVINSAVIINIFSYFACAFFGYVSFLQNTPGNLINAYEPGSFLATVSMFAMTLVIAFSFPLIQFPIKRSVALFFPAKLSPSLHYPLTIIFFILPFACSIFIKDLSIILGIMGSTLGILIAYILPALMFLKLRASDFGTVDAAQTNPTRAEFGRFGAVVCIILGLIIGIIGFVRNVGALIDSL